MLQGGHRRCGGRKPPVNRSCDELLSRAGLAADEHRRIAAGDLARAREHPRQRRRGADNLLEHRRSVDFLSQGDVFLLESLPGGLAIADFGPPAIPAEALTWVLRTRARRSR